MRDRRCLIIFLVSLMHCLAGLGAEVRSAPTAVVNFSRYDIEAVGFGQSPGVAAMEAVPDTLARRVVNFRYMRAGGVLGAIFQTSYVDSKTKGFKVDDSFRVWGPSAAANGIRVGVYHFYRQGKMDDAEQARMFLNTVKQTCLDHPEQLKGVPVLMAIDATTVGAEKDPGYDQANLLHVDRIIRFMEEIQRQTGKAPGFYPENALSGWWGENAIKISAAQKQKLKPFWLWASRYSRTEPLIPAAIWSRWTLWQYSAGEFWYAKPNGGFEYMKKTGDKWVTVDGKKAPWQPATQPPTVAETGWQWKALEGGVEVEYKSAERIGYDPLRFPIGVPGSAIPLECNFFSGSTAQLLQFWDAGGWMASPK